MVGVDVASLPEDVSGFGIEAGCAVGAEFDVWVAFERIEGLHIVAALIILCREILVSGLREFLAALTIQVPVTRLAKWKTALQLVALGGLILGEAAPVWLPAEFVGLSCLWIAAALTAFTGYGYMRAGMKHIW